MRQGEVQARRKDQVSDERQQPQQLEKESAPVDETNRHEAAQEARDNVERREAYRLNGAPQQALRIGLCKEAAVDNDLDHKQYRQNSDLQKTLSRARQACRPGDPVTRAEQVALPFRIVEPSPQAEELVTTQCRFGAKLANSFGGSLLNNREPLFEVERRQPLIIDVKMI